MASISELQAIYCQADRCWRVNNLKSCLQLCDDLSRALKNNDSFREGSRAAIQLANLVWFLKIKCLAENHFVDESLLLNEDDVDEDNDQVQTFTPSTKQFTQGKSTRSGTSRAFGEPDRRKVATGIRLDSSRGQFRTGMLTGKMPTRSSSRQTGRATSSYRPLTTSLTATQTAFSRSTKPLLRYSVSDYLAKPIYEYLYNTQRINNRCPDYRQCLEYLTLVQKNPREAKIRERGIHASKQKRFDENHAKSQLKGVVTDSGSTKQSSNPFWCLAYAICYFNLKMHKLTEEYLRIALGANLKYLDPYLWLIKVYLRMNQPMKVLETCQDGLLNVNNPILYNWKARVQSLLNQTYAAHLSLRESIQYYPTNIEALANVGYYAFYGDKLELSFKCFERIYQLTSCYSGFAGSDAIVGSCPDAELLNNLALLNFRCGNYTRVIPLFQRAFMSSPNKEITSTIWYNLSFVPLCLGSRQLAMACLRLALKNDSQNEEAVNNLGVLKYEHLVNDPLHYGNRQEYWSETSSRSTRTANESGGLQNRTDQRRQQALFDDAETFFCAPQSEDVLESDECVEESGSIKVGTPVMVYNMAVLKRKRGHLLASTRFCKMYLESDQNNYTIQSILSEIQELVSHDS